MLLCADNMVGSTGRQERHEVIKGVQFQLTMLLQHSYCSLSSLCPRPTTLSCFVTRPGDSERRAAMIDGLPRLNKCRGLYPRRWLGHVSDRSSCFSLNQWYVQASCGHYCSIGAHGRIHMTRVQGCLSITILHGIDCEDPCQSVVSV